MPWSCSGDPTLKGKALIVALEAEKKFQFPVFARGFLTGFWTGVAFICWMLLC